METKTTDCIICASPLVEKLNAKKNWQTPRILRWAELRDLNINESILAEHLGSHISDNGDSPVKKKIKQKRVDTAAEQQPPPVVVSNEVISSDEQLLDLIIRQIYADLKSEKLDLKIEHAFKAIELKQKLSESGNVENLLLELLNEIRNQELPK